MAVHNKSEIMYSNNCEDIPKKKVYVNPNFNRATANNFPCNPVMHVNPRFSHLLTHVQSNSLMKPRIFVNPDFMKSQAVNDDNTLIKSTTNVNSYQNNSIIDYPNSSYSPEHSVTERETQPAGVPVTKSRYSYVRQNTTKALEVSTVDKIKTTVQLNKYKSVTLNAIKRSLDNVINKKSTIILNSKAASRFKKNVSPTAAIVDKNQFKLVNQRILTIMKNDKVKTKPILPSNKKTVLVSNSHSKLKKMNSTLKINNIPCPTFRKFGKCLRKIRGGCEFLHDKKHVSICRKFIKGLCHDKDCLLSHDLTTKKMPTCHFYLQGTCTKPDCPYLHVKLNEKVKICADFLKGYCEKGSKCLQRHINKHNEKTDQTVFVTTSGLKNTKEKFNRDFKVKKNIDINLINENNPDCRYYQEHNCDENLVEACEIIKPTRCKLGTLPSFIQL